MFRLNRNASFWFQPWFLVIAIVCGQFYGVWWMSLAKTDRTYFPSTMVVARAADGFDIVITAPGLPGPMLKAAN